MMKRKVLAAMALAVTISAVPLTAYASATVSDSTSVNTESQVNSESQDSVATPTPASGDASTPTPEPSTMVEPETSPNPTTTVTPAPTETPAATEVPASAETPSQSPTEAPTTTPTETPEQPEYKAGWNSVDVEGKKQWFFYDAEAKAPKTGLFTEGDKTYLAAADTGYLLTGVQSIEENGTVHTYYFSEEGGQPGTDSAYGTRVTGLAADGKYYGPDLAVNKLVQVNGGTYYAGADGTFVKDGFGTVGEKTYYFDKEGKLFTGEGWITVQDQTYYIVKDNNQESVVCKDGNEESTDEKTSWLKLDGSWYLLDRADGHRLTGLQKNENDLYYLDPAQEGKMFTSTNQEDGWLNLDGTWYFFRGWGGALNNGWNKLGNDWYWFHEDCSMGSAEWIDDGENLYYVRDWGGMLHDQWRQENGIWYYFRGWGAALNNGWSKIGNDWYWFNSDCKMGSDQWLQQGNDWYYLRDWGGRLHDQWYKVGNDWYYFGSDGKMLHDQWLQQGNNWYYLRGWGGRLHDQWFTKDGKTYYFQSSGVRYQNGTFVIDGKSYTFDANGCRVDAGWTYIDGYRRYRNADGSLSNDVSAIFNPSSKYITVDRIRGITTIYGYNSETGKYDTPIKSMWCSVGNPITLSAAGTYNIGWQLRSKKMVGAGNSYVCWASYVSQIYGAVYFHGVASGSPDLNSVAKSDFEALGRPMSHGCIRLAACDAKWIYENVKGGTTVQIGDNFGCPMSNPVRYQWTGGAYGPDPTYS